MEDKKETELRKSLTLLYEVGNLVSSDYYLEEILVRLVDVTAKIMDSKICSLMILDEKKQVLAIKATQSLSAAYRHKPPVRIKGSVIGQAVVKKQAVVVADVKAEAGYQYPDVAKSENLCSLVSVPLVAKGTVLGVLNCYTTEKRIFSDEEIQGLMGVASHAALAIENAKLAAEKISAVEALETRKKVERAKALLIKRYKLSEEEAFRKLQKQSMDRRVSLREIAEAILLAEDVAASS